MVLESSQWLQGVQCTILWFDLFYLDKIVSGIVRTYLAPGLIWWLMTQSQGKPGPCTLPLPHPAEPLLGLH